MNELFDQIEDDIVHKENILRIQCEDVQQSINRTFNKIFEQLIEIRRFCRNDIEQQSLNIQVCSTRMNMIVSLLLLDSIATDARYHSIHANEISSVQFESNGFFSRSFRGIKSMYESIGEINAFTSTRFG